MYGLLGTTRYLDDELNYRWFGSDVIPADVDFVKSISKKESFEHCNHSTRQNIQKLIQMVCDECNLIY